MEETVRRALEAAAVQGEMWVEVPRAPGRKTRRARLSVRFLPLACGPPQSRRGDASLPKVALNWILVEEQSPPANTKAIRWLLATTLPVAELADAVRLRGLLSRRWLIERFHYTLKSGCQVEERLLESLENIERMLATMSIVAWRVMWLVFESQKIPISHAR